MPPSRGEVFQDILGEWRFRIIDRAGKITTGSRGYVSAGEAHQTLIRLGVTEPNIEDPSQ